MKISFSKFGIFYLIPTMSIFYAHTTNRLCFFIHFLNYVIQISFKGLEDENENY